MEGIAPTSCHIFLKECTSATSRGLQGNGLGQVIAKELISVHKEPLPLKTALIKGQYLLYCFQSPVNNAGLSCYKTKKNKVSARLWQG